MARANAGRPIFPLNLPSAMATNIQGDDLG